MGLGIMQYTQDYDEALPYSYMGTGPGNFRLDSLLWADVMQPYTKSLQLFRCPSNTNANSPVNDPTAAPGGSELRMAYGAADCSRAGMGHAGGDYNGAFISDSSIAPVTRLPQFTNVSETYMVGEIQDSPTVRYSYNMVPADGDGAANGKVAGKTHFDGSNWLYADGHVKYKLQSKADEEVNGVIDYYWLRVKP